MNRHRIPYFVVAFLLAAALLVPTTATRASPPVPEPPLSIAAMALGPPSIPVPVSEPVVSAQLTTSTIDANSVDGGRLQESPGRGIYQMSNGHSAGLSLYDSPEICNDFNVEAAWSSSDGTPGIWRDWYSGWAPLALDGGAYNAQMVMFSLERTVGPGNRYNDSLSSDGREEFSAKIASQVPYAASFGSPRIPVPDGYEGGQVKVSTRYLIWDHDTGGKAGGADGIDYDWASLGVKPGADGDVALYTNGYVRGQWAEMIAEAELGDAADVMVLLQAQSPVYLNSNIYFDDVSIAFTDVDGNMRYLSDCTAEEAIK